MAFQSNTLPDQASNPQQQQNQQQHHRKIELQSTQDLTYLQTKLQLQAKSKLDLHFPLIKSIQPATFIPLDGSTTISTATTSSNTNINNIIDDPMRIKVQFLVDSFIDRIWEGAKSGISVNGLDVINLPIPIDQERRGINTGMSEVEGKDFIYENYDSKLQSKLAGMYSELESLTSQVSKLRREAPSKGARSVGEGILRNLQSDDENYHGDRKEEVEMEGKDLDLNLSGMIPSMQEDMNLVYCKGLSELSRLVGLNSSNITAGGDGDGGGINKNSLTETVGKVQRAMNVVLELE